MTRAPRGGDRPPDTSAVPNPGSDAAIARACTCPVADNGHGRGSGWGSGTWWIVEGCPLHWPTDPRPAA